MLLAAKLTPCKTNLNKMYSMLLRNLQKRFLIQWFQRHYHHHHGDSKWYDIQQGGVNADFFLNERHKWIYLGIILRWSFKRGGFQERFIALEKSKATLGLCIKTLAESILA